MKKNPKLEERRKKMQEKPRYIKHDEFVLSCLKRIAVAQEIQADFYLRWDKKMEKMWDILEQKMLVEALEG